MKNINKLRGILLLLVTATVLMALLVACSSGAPEAAVELTPVESSTEVAPSVAVATEAATAVTTSSQATVTVALTDSATAAQKALTWLRSQQLITNSSYVSSEATSVESLLAVAASQEDAGAWRPADGAPSLLDFVLANSAGYAHNSVGEAGKLAVALSAVEACWPAGAVKPSDYYSPTIDALSADGGPLAWGIMGTLALSEAVPTGSVDYLRSLALADGGWEWSPGWGRDTNSTALALQALVAAGVPLTDSAIVSGEAYLDSAQTSEGGYSYDPNASWGNVADANSTAYVLQGLKAVGVDAPKEAIAFLISLQGPEGALGWQREQPAASLGSTQQAIPALLGQAYPIKRVALKACK